MDRLTLILITGRSTRQGIGISEGKERPEYRKATAAIDLNQVDMARSGLRNGDTIQVGSLKLQFWLSETRQHGLRLREWFVWTLIGAISLAQIAAVYWLLP